MTASIGIVIGHRDYETADDVMRDADTAMARAKAAGRAGYASFDRTLFTRSTGRTKIEDEVRKGLENGEFKSYYQPIFTVDGQKLLGFEALLRWSHPERGLLTPAAFLHVAEDTGLILPIGDASLRESIGRLKAWDKLEGGATGLTMAVDLSQRQFDSPDLAERVEAVLKEFELSPSRLHFEMTEPVFLANPRAADAVLRRLKQSGVQLHLDDFGVGYASLNYSSRFEPHALKIDRSLIADISINPRRLSVVHTILAMAEDLNIATIAVGVENKAQLRLLKKLGCAQAQGYLLGRPMDAEAAEAFIRQGAPEEVR